MAVNIIEEVQSIFKKNDTLRQNGTVDKVWRHYLANYSEEIYYDLCAAKNIDPKKGDPVPSAIKELGSLLSMQMAFEADRLTGDSQYGLNQTQLDQFRQDCLQGCQRSLKELD